MGQRTTDLDTDIDRVTDTDINRDIDTFRDTDTDKTTNTDRDRNTDRKTDHGLHGHRHGNLNAQLPKNNSVERVQLNIILENCILSVDVIFKFKLSDIQ
jgi:hypothetical protein